MKFARRLFHEALILLTPLTALSEEAWESKTLLTNFHAEGAAVGDRGKTGRQSEVR
jgi:hypothetical protein